MKIWYKYDKKKDKNKDKKKDPAKQILVSEFYKQ